MRPIQFRSAVLIAAFAAMAGLACASSNGRKTTPPPPPVPVSCQGFNVGPMQPITVQPGARFERNIPGGHRIEFATGAVTKPSTYEITAGPNAAAPDYWAEIEIRPLADADTIFSADVFLEISYAACRPKAGILKMRMEKPALNLVESLGGRNDTGRDVLRALIPHLTLFSIAR